MIGAILSGGGIHIPEKSVLIRNRWHLAVLLSLNPSLIKYRKKLVLQQISTEQKGTQPLTIMVEVHDDFNNN